MRRESLRKRGVWGERVVRESKTKKKLSPCGSVFRAHSAAAAPLTRVRCVHVRTKPRLGCRAAAISEEQCVRWPETGAVGGRAPAAGGCSLSCGRGPGTARQKYTSCTHAQACASSPKLSCGRGRSGRELAPHTRDAALSRARHIQRAFFFFFLRAAAHSSNFFLVNNSPRHPGQRDQQGLKGGPRKLGRRLVQQSRRERDAQGRKAGDEGSVGEEGERKGGGGGRVGGGRGGGGAAVGCGGGRHWLTCVCVCVCEACVCAAIN